VNGDTLHLQATQQISYQGTNPDTLKNCRLWRVGPEWLSQHQEQWLNTPLLRHPEPPPEQREVTTVKVRIQCSPEEFITRFFNAIKTAKSSSILFEIFSQCKKPVVRRTGYLTSTEL